MSCDLTLKIAPMTLELDLAFSISSTPLKTNLKPSSSAGPTNSAVGHLLSICFKFKLEP